MGDSEGVYEYATWRKTGPDLRPPMEEELGIELADYLDRCAKVGYTVVRRRIIVVEGWEVVQKPPKGEQRGPRAWPESLSS
jgi:hypothetical protein